MRPLKSRLFPLSLLLLGFSVFTAIIPLAGAALAQDQQPAQASQQTDQQPGQLANGLLDAAVTDLGKAKKTYASLLDAAKQATSDDETLVALSGQSTSSTSPQLLFPHV